MPTAVGKSSYSCPPLDVYVKPNLGALSPVSPLYTSPAFLSVTVGLPPLSRAAVIPIFFLVTVKLKYLTVSLSPADVSGVPLNLSPSAARSALISAFTLYVPASLTSTLYVISSLSDLYHVFCSSAISSNVSVVLLYSADTSVGSTNATLPLCSATKPRFK